VPEGQPAPMTRLIRAAGLRWPVEEDCEIGKDDFGPDQSSSGSTTRSPGTLSW